MSTTQPRRTIRVPLVLAAVALTAAPFVAPLAVPLGAQAVPAARSLHDEVATVAGTVRGPDGVALVGAEVVLTPVLTGTGVTVPRRTVTNERGQFTIPSIPHGQATIAVRRIGYRPVTLETAVPAAVGLDFLLDAAAVQLNRVVVQDRRSQYDGPMAAFNRRRDLGFGRFLTRDDIERRGAIRTTDLLRMIPGIAIGAPRGGVGTAPVRIRNNNCSPFIWLDGSPALNGYLDVDAFDPSTLEGVEIYNGVSTVPVELRGPRGEERCGVIALWSRVAERRPRKSKKKPVTADELAALVASATVYTADQVDRAAQADTTQPMEVYYPDSLKAARIAGSVVVEFVVDTVGHVETETIGIVLATHPRFAEAARNAVWNARFVPAMHNGRPVRQVVQIPVTFEVAGAK